MSEPHEHEWTLHQNVTTKGYALPPYRVCAVCGRAVRLPDAPPCGDEVSSLVQAARDHAATMRRLAVVEAELKAERDRTMRVLDLCGGPDSIGYRPYAVKLDNDVILAVGLDDLRVALADPEGGN